MTSVNSKIIRTTLWEEPNMRLIAFVAAAVIAGSPAAAEEWQEYAYPDYAFTDAYGGRHPNGTIMYGRDGRFLVLITFDGRAKPDGSAAGRPSSLDDGLWGDVHIRWCESRASYRYIVE
jgi:hypothetical protein